MCHDKLVEHRQYIDEYGKDLPEVANGNGKIIKVSIY